MAAVEVREFNDVPKDGASDTVGGRYVFHHMTYTSMVPDGPEGTPTTRWPVHEVGRNADIFAPEAGLLLTAGSVLDLETAHLHANGARGEGASQVRVQAASEGVRAGGEVHECCLGQWCRHRYQADAGWPGAPCLQRVAAAHQDRVV